MAIDAAAERFKRDHEQLAWAAWHVAALQRNKRLPPLLKLLGRKAKPLQGTELEKRRREHAEMVARMMGHERADPGSG